MKILLVFNCALYVLTSLDTLKKKYLETRYEVSELVILRHPSDNKIITEVINQHYETKIHDIKMYCGRSLDDNEIEVNSHLGKSMIFPVTLFINGLIQSTEFKNCFVCDDKTKDTISIKNDLINKCKWIWTVFSNDEITSIADDIMCLDKTKIILNNKDINVKNATEECIKILNKCYIHLSVNDVPFLVEQKDPSKKNITSLFYLTFENKDNGKKYKTPIYKMEVKNYHVVDLSEEFREEKSHLSMPLILVGTVILLLSVITGIYIYKNHISTLK